MTVDEGPVKVGDTTYDGKNIRISPDGDIQRADSLDVDGNHFENVQDFKRLGDGRYEVERADYLQDNGRKIIKGKFITGGEEQMEAEQAETVQDDEAVASSVIDYSSDDDKFSVGEAKAVVVDNSVFSDIKNSSFTTDGDELEEAHVTSNKDNNTFDIDGVEITLNKGDSADIVKNDTTGKYDVAIDSANGTVEDRYGNVACVDVSAGSRYRYLAGELEDDFGLHFPL